VSWENVEVFGRDCTHVVDSFCLIRPSAARVSVPPRRCDVSTCAGAGAVAVAYAVEVSAPVEHMHGEVDYFCRGVTSIPRETPRLNSHSLRSLAPSSIPGVDRQRNLNQSRVTQMRANHKSSRN
jgi:hypothetical protein